MHRMCELQLFEQKGQKRNAYYVAGQEFIRLTSCADREMYGANKEKYGANELPEALKEKILKIGKRVPEEEMKKLLIELCDLHPFSLYEMSILLHRNMVF